MERDIIITATPKATAAVATLMTGPESLCPALLANSSFRATDDVYDITIDPGHGGRGNGASYDSVLEDEILSMQYKEILNFAHGHGCATNFLEKNGKCENVWSEFIPVYELQQMKSPEVEDSELFSLKFLFSSSREKVVSRLKNFVELYKKWGENQKILSKDKSFDKYKKAVEHCLNKIEVCINRICNGIDCLIKDDIAWKAFVYANKAMYKQRISMALIKNKIKHESEFSIKISEPTWYPFQLFYLLMIIPDFVDEKSQFKDVVDLLWFPTGGGKTEAYLAVSSFIIFYERLSKKKNFYGTTIIMRYTLRLLTIQQFERASALICACEKVRKEENLYVVKIICSNCQKSFGGHFFKIFLQNIFLYFKSIVIYQL